MQSILLQLKEGEKVKYNINVAFHVSIVIPSPSNKKVSWFSKPKKRKVKEKKGVEEKEEEDDVDNNTNSLVSNVIIIVILLYSNFR